MELGRDSPELRRSDGAQSGAVAAAAAMGARRTAPPGAAAGLAQRLRSRNARSPAEPPARLRGAAGHRVPHRPPRTEPSRSGSRRRPLPGAPRRTKPPAALTGSLSPSSALAHRSSSSWKCRRRGAGRECGRLPRPAAHSAAPDACPPRSARGRAPARSVRSSSGQRLNLQTSSSSSSSRPGRGVCETPLLHAAPAAQPLPQPLPGEARPGSGLVLALLSFSSLLRRPPAPEAGKGGEERLTTRICLWNGAKESSRITAPGRRREEKGMGEKKNEREKKKPNHATVFTQGKALGSPALPRVSGHSLSARLRAPSPPRRAAYRLLSATKGLKFNSQV